MKAPFRYLVVAVSLLVPTLAFAAVQILVLKDGRSIRAQSWEAKNTVIELINERGEKVVIRKELVDLDKSRAATEAAKRTPTPTPTPREKGMVEISREIQERRRPNDNQPLEPVTKIKVPPRPSPVPTTETVGATPLPEPTPVPSETVVIAGASTPAPEAQKTPKAAGPVSTPPPAPASSPLLLYGGIGLGVVAVLGVGGFLALRKKPKSGARRAAAPAPAPAKVSDELLSPAFADESPAEDLPAPAEFADEFSAPAEVGGSSTATRSLPEAPPEVANPGILAEGEVQIRISGDVYTCPSLSALKRWVEEGRVIENSEILAPDGSWLMAGTIPDLESAFASRRETLGY